VQFVAKELGKIPPRIPQINTKKEKNKFVKIRAIRGKKVLRFCFVKFVQFVAKKFLGSSS